jgi:hypothetical protein
MKTYRIPRYIRLEKVFLGASGIDLVPLSLGIVGGFVALKVISAQGIGLIVMMCLVMTGHSCSVLLHRWRRKRLPGGLRAALFRFGLISYGRGFSTDATLWTGNVKGVRRGRNATNEVDR